MHLSPYQVLSFLHCSPFFWASLCAFLFFFVVFNIFWAIFFLSCFIQSLHSCFGRYKSCLLTRQEKLGNKSKFAFFANDALRHFLLSDYSKTNFISLK